MPKAVKGRYIFFTKALTVYFLFVHLFLNLWIVDKELVVQMGLLEPILDLLESEDPTVQCNSCACTMTLAVSGECAVLSLYPLQRVHSTLTSYFKVKQPICNWFKSHKMQQQILVFPHHKYNFLRSFSQFFWPSFFYDCKPFSDFQPKYIHDQLILISAYIGFWFSSSPSLMSMPMRLLHFSKMKKPSSFKTTLASEALHSSS